MKLEVFMRIQNIFIISFFICVLFATLIYDKFSFWQYPALADFALADFNPWLVGNLKWTYWVMQIYSDPPPFVVPMIFVRVADNYLQNEFALLYLTKIPNFLIDTLIGPSIVIITIGVMLNHVTKEKA